MADRLNVVLSPGSSPGSKTFLGIPTEIRLLIYHAIFSRSDALLPTRKKLTSIIASMNSWLIPSGSAYAARAQGRTKALNLLRVNSANNLQVLLTCRQVYLEARATAFALTFWDIRLPDMVFHLLDVADRRGPARGWEPHRTKVLHGIFIDERLRALDAKVAALGPEQRSAIATVHVAPQMMPYEVWGSRRREEELPRYDVGRIFARHRIEPSCFVVYLWPPRVVGNGDRLWRYDFQSFLHCLVSCTSVGCVQITESLDADVGIEDPGPDERRHCGKTLQNLYKSVKMEDGWFLWTNIEMLELESEEDWEGRVAFEVLVRGWDGEKRMVRVCVSILKYFRGVEREVSRGLNVLADRLV